MQTTAVLSVSKVNMNCHDIVRLFYNMGVAASVTNNVSVTKNKGVCAIEPGCRIVLTVEKRQELDKVWDELRSSMGLTCGHLKIAGGFSGCTKKYFGGAPR